MRFGPLVAVTLALLLPLAAGAQALGGLGGASTDPFTLTVSPSSPTPYSQVSVSVSSDTLSLTNATLAVLVNGQPTYSGAVHTFSVTLGAAGSVTKVQAVLSASGDSFSKTISIQPQDVVLIAEPIASAPPLYLGKPSVPLSGNVRMVAIANLKDASGKATSPASYAYAWTVDGIQQSDSSGIGKSSIIVPSPLQYRESSVSVAVSNGSGSLTSSASFTLAGTEPSVRIYENDPLLGIRFDHALSGSYTINGTEDTLYAAPFSLPITNGAPVVQWFLSGTPVQTGNSVTLRPAGSGQGSASLSLTASGGSLTTATANLSLLFGLPKSSNLFGL